MTTPRVTLNGESCAMFKGSKLPTWRIQAGISSPEIVWSLEPGHAARVLATTEPISAFFDFGDRTLAVSGIYVIREEPSGSRFFRNVVLADVRWLLTQKILGRSYNVRTRTGSLRRVGNDPSQPLQVQSVADEIAFAVYSLGDDEKARTGDEILRNAFDACFGVNGWVNLARPRPELYPNDVELVGRADNELGRAMGLVGGVDLYVTARGIPVLYDRVLGREKDYVEGTVLRRRLRDLGALRWIDMSHVVPAFFDGNFYREVEFRADYAEGTEQDASTREPVLDQVVRISDATLTISGKTEIRGAYAEISAWLTAIESAYPATQPSPGALTLPKIRERWLGPTLELQYVMGLSTQPDPIWEGRVASLRRCFRRTFRLRRRFMTGVLPGSLRAVRVATVDTANGTRQKSPVFMDYCKKPTLRFLAKQADVKLGWNQDCLPGAFALGVKSYTSDLVKDFTPAPAEVTILDPEVGVLEIDLVPDLFGEAAQLVPGLVAELPSANPQRVADSSALALWEAAKLSGSHRVRTILSAIPAGPNSEDQFHKVLVSVSQAYDRLGIDATQQNNGRVRSFLIGPRSLTARFEWDDARREELLGCFDPKKARPLNLTPVNDDVLKDYATAQAASILAQLLDHYEGTQAIPLEPDAVPVGSITAIEHAIDPLGRGLTTIVAERVPAPTQPETLMSQSTRRAVLREIGP